MTLLKSASSVLTTNSSSALPSTIPTTSTVSPSACFRDGHSMSLASARTSPKKPDPIPAPEDEEEGEAPPSLSAARAALILARSAGERPPPGVSAPAEAARAAAWREVVFGVFGFWSFWFLEEVGVERGKKSRRPGRRAVDSPHNFPLFSARSPPYAKCRSLFPTCCSRAAAAATAESSLSLPLAASDEDDGDSSTFFAGASTEDSAAASRASASEPSSPGPRLRPG